MSELRVDTITDELGTGSPDFPNGITVTSGTIDGATIGGTTAGAGTFTTASADSVTTPLVTNAGTLAVSATGANVITAATNGVERMRITDAGNVGIGTSSPQATWAAGRIGLLSVEQAERYANLAVMAYTGPEIAGSGGPVLTLGRSRSGTVGTRTETLSGDFLGVVTCEGINSSNTMVSGAYILAVQSAAAGASFIPADLYFLTGTNAAAPAERFRITSDGVVRAGADNTQTLGSGAFRWSEVFAGNGTINTSDAREKTEVRDLTADEIAAAKDLGREIGAYKFLHAVELKGEDARTHIGMTVQRAIEIMESHNLNPLEYGFICHDEWDEVTVEHPAVEAVEGQDAWTETIEHEAKLDENGEVIKEAWTETTLEAGDRYGFRLDQLMLFIARGFEARLSALEA